MVEDASSRRLGARRMNELILEKCLVMFCGTQDNSKVDVAESTEEAEVSLFIVCQRLASPQSRASGGTPLPPPH